jgi:hypothetical protein
MLKVKLHFVRTAIDDHKVDVISIYDEQDRDRMYRVVFCPGDITSSQYEFYMDHCTVMSYITGVLGSLVHDMDPFQEVQVTTPLQPSILYSVDDLECCVVHTRILETIHLALESFVDRMPQ